MEKLGLIAGEGRLPLEIARAARQRGASVVGIGFPGLTDPALEAAVDHYSVLRLGEVEKLLASLRDAGVRHAVLAGKVPKSHLVKNLAALHLDDLAKRLLAELSDRGDDSILSGVAIALEDSGISLRPQAELVPELLVPEGVLGAVVPTPAQLADVAFGWEVAKALGAVDVGQSVVVQDCAVLAVEAIEGTDAAIRRGGVLGRPGVCVVKVAKPSQDPRFDLPAVGLGTLEAMIEAGAGLLAVEAGSGLVLDRDELQARADAAGVALLGVSERWLTSAGRG